MGSGRVPMTEVLRANWLKCLTSVLLACMPCAGAERASAAVADLNSAASLRAKYASLRDELSHSQFQRPLTLTSIESSNQLKGEIYALVDYPFATLNAALNGPAHWCDVLILHLNTKYCHASMSSTGAIFNVNIGSKYDQPLAKTYRVEFAFRIAAATRDYLDVVLSADYGPLSTRNYGIVFEAVPLDATRTLIHLSYAYEYGLTGRLAMQAYLATTGRRKVGFTITGKQPDGTPSYIAGMRGVVERNTMRYYLAIEAYLDASAAPPQNQFEKRLQVWYAATERYPRQLHEIEQDVYLEMKRREFRRQQTEQ
jgi:hypothetical protein